jgi:hypothetical protein
MISRAFATRVGSEVTVSTGTLSSSAGGNAKQSRQRRLLQDPRLAAELTSSLQVVLV